MKFLIVLFIFSFACSFVEAQCTEPPIAKKDPKVTNIHGVKLVDDYAWLRNKSDEEVIKYLKDENSFADYFMEDTKILREKLFDEMKSRIKETDLSVPIKKGDYMYYSRTEAGKQYYIYCRKPLGDDSKEEIYFDENIYAENKPFFALGALSLSADQNILAYSADYTGAEKYDLHFLDLTTKKEYPEVITKTGEDLIWAEDNKTVFYTLSDQTGRANVIMMHKLGTDPAQDKKIFEENDGKFTVGLDKSRDKKYVFVVSASTTTTEVYYIDAADPDSGKKLFAPRKSGIEYSLYHHNGSFYIVTNENALNYKVMRTSDTNIDHSVWEEFIPTDSSSMIEEFEEFSDHLVVTYVENGLKCLKYYDCKNSVWTEIPFDEAAYSFFISGNPEFKTDTLRFYYQSLTTPSSVFEYGFKTKTVRLLKQEEVPDKKFSASNYKSERIYARAKDGMAIPISLVYRKDLHGNGPSPLYLNGYGSYGVSSDPYFSTCRLSLLDRGFIFAIAHIRGGEELGKAWYNDGKLLKKKNTFTDFIACAEHLIRSGYTTKEMLTANGGSAGGLLMGAVTNMRPDLFRIVVAQVPFVDVMNTMLDITLPLVQEEYEEWGDPNNKEYFDYMLSYSPYDNVKPASYPNMLVTGGLNDPRVSYWEPAKLVAKLRVNNKSNNVILLKTNMDAGHGGASGRYDYLKEIAFEYAFILKILGMNK